MKYKLIDIISSTEKVEFGTCELCMYVGDLTTESYVFEDEKGEKITIEGLLTIVLRTAVINGQYLFSTKNNGADTVKAPMGLFEDEHIDNDLAAVDAAIFGYYQLQPTN